MCDTNGIAGKGGMYEQILLPTCPVATNRRKNTGVRMDASSPTPKKRMDFKRVSCRWNKLLGDPRGWDFSIPWVELGISKSAS